MHLQATQDLYSMVGKVAKIFRKSACCEGDKAGTMPVLALLFKEQMESGRRRMRMTELSRRLMITKPAATQAVNKLVEKGLVERLADENDRRVVYIQPTGDGKRVFESELEEKLMLLDRVVARMGREESEELVKLLDRFFNAMSAELEEEK